MAKLIEMGEVSYTNVFIDGTKIEANANKYSFVWAKAVEKNLQKLEAKIEAATKSIAFKYGLAPDICFENMLRLLMNKAAAQKITFVHGKGKHKTQLQKDIDTLMEYGDRRHKYIENLKIAGSRKCYSKIGHKSKNDRTIRVSHKLNEQNK